MSTMATNPTCCCCLLRPPVRDMKTPYTRRDTTVNTEIYSDMLADCFGIHVGREYDECGICKVCVARLRYASDFKLQVQRSQGELQARLKGVFTANDEPEIKLEKCDDNNLPDMLMFNYSVKLEEPDLMSDNNSFSLKADEQAVAFSERASPMLSPDNNSEHALSEGFECSIKEEPHAYEDTSRHRPVVMTPRHQKQARKNSKRNTLRVHKEKKTRNTRRSQSEQENDTNYALRSKVTVKIERPLKGYRDVHTTGPYTCEICNMVIATKRSMACHMQNHNESKLDVGEEWDCDKCHKMFSSKDAMKSHVKSVHIKRRFRCRICHKRFPDISYLNLHKAQHTEQERERKYCCEICGKRFFQCHHLKAHKELHTGEKQYGCDTCGKKFAAKRNLKTHLLTHVKGITYSCELCPKSYATKESLRQHKRIHTRDKDVKKKT